MMPKICPYFIQGLCKYGNSCKNRHEAQSLAQTPSILNRNWRASNKFNSSEGLTAALEKDGSASGSNKQYVYLQRLPPMRSYLENGFSANANSKFLDSHPAASTSREHVRKAIVVPSVMKILSPPPIPRNSVVLQLFSRMAQRSKRSYSQQISLLFNFLTCQQAQIGPPFLRY